MSWPAINSFSGRGFPASLMSINDVAGAELPDPGSWLISGIDLLYFQLEAKFLNIRARFEDGE